MRDGNKYKLDFLHGSHARKFLNECVELGFVTGPTHEFSNYSIINRIRKPVYKPVKITSRFYVAEMWRIALEHLQLRGGVMSHMDSFQSSHTPIYAAVKLLYLLSMIAYS